MNTQSTFNHTCNEISEPQIVRLPLHTCKLAEMMRDDDDGDEKDDSNKDYTQTSLVAQWLRTRLPMQGTQVRSLVRDDPTCYGAAKPVCHNY